MTQVVFVGISKTGLVGNDGRVLVWGAWER